MELTADVHARIKAFADQRGESMGSVLGEFAAYGINQFAPSASAFSVDPRTGLPRLHFDRAFTSADVAEMIAED